MSDKLLKIFLVNKVEVSYLLNFLVLFTAHLALQHQNVWKFFTDNASTADNIYLAILLFIVYLLVAVPTLLMVGKDSLGIGRGMASYVLAVDLLILIVFTMAAAGGEQAEELTLELALVLFLFVRYSIKFVILFVYFVLGKISHRGGYRIKMYEAIDKRLSDAVGTYQMSLWQAVLVPLASVLALAYLRVSAPDINVFVQFLLVFSLANIASFIWQSVQGGRIVKN